MTDLKRYFISEDEINKVIAGENITLTAVTLRRRLGQNVPNAFFWQLPAYGKQYKFRYFLN